MFNTWFNSGSRHLPAQLPVPTKLKRVASPPGTRGIALAGTQLERKNIAARRAADPHESEVISGAPLSEWRSRRRLRLPVGSGLGAVAMQIRPNDGAE